MSTEKIFNCFSSKCRKIALWLNPNKNGVPKRSQNLILKLFPTTPPPAYDLPPEEFMFL